MKKKFSTYGNCQAYAIAQNLLAIPEFSEQYDYVPIGPCFSTTHAEQSAFLIENNKKLDLFLSQNLSEGWHGGDSLWDVSRIASECLKDDGKLLKYAEIYSRHCTPHLAYPITFPRFKEFDYLDLIALKLASDEKLNTQNYLKIINSEKFTQSSIFHDLYTLSLSEIKNREINCSSITSDSFEAARLNGKDWFHTFNHPSKWYLNEFSAIICKNIGVNFKGTELLKFDHLDSVRIPSIGGLKKNFSILDNSEVFDIFIEGRHLNLASYIQLQLSLLYREKVKIPFEIQEQAKNKITEILFSIIQETT